MCAATRRERPNAARGNTVHPCAPSSVRMSVPVSVAEQTAGMTENCPAGSLEPYAAVLCDIDGVLRHWPAHDEPASTRPSPGRSPTSKGGPLWPPTDPAGTGPRPPRPGHPRSCGGEHRPHRRRQTRPTRLPHSRRTRRAPTARAFPAGMAGEHARRHHRPGRDGRIDRADWGERATDRIGSAVVAVPVTDVPSTQLVLTWGPGIRPRHETHSYARPRV